MLFPTFTFAIFFVLVFIGNWLLMPRHKVWKPFILVASYVFYGWWDVRFLLLLAGSAVVNQFLSQTMERAATPRMRKILLAVTVAVDLGLLGWFKYYGFFVTSFVNFFGTVGIHMDVAVMRIVLPVGISFLTFRVLSYVIDIYRGKIASASLLDFAIYVAFFPYIMAGPIARASEFIPQLDAPRDPRRIDTGRAFFLIFSGLVKKMLLADYLGKHIVNGVFSTPGQYTSLEVLMGIIGYAVQIYCDFSAYSDIAIGVSLLLGFKLPLNFDAPYTSRSVQEFWRRWHITLSNWLRDYLYIPLGGSRRGQVRTYVNLFATMLLGGLWHGAAWTFVFWGGWQGAGLVFEHWRVDRRRARAERREARARAFDDVDLADIFGVSSRPAWTGEAEEDMTPPVAAAPVVAAAAAEPAGDDLVSPWPVAAAAPAAAATSTTATVVAPARPAAAPPHSPTVRDPISYDREPWHGQVVPRIAVFAFICAGWVFFRSPTFGAALSVFAGLFQDWGSIGAAVTPVLILVLVIGVGMQYVPRRFWERGEASFSLLNPIIQGILMGLAFMLINSLVSGGPAEFLYFRF